MEIKNLELLALDSEKHFNKPEKAEYFSTCSFCKLKSLENEIGIKHIKKEEVYWTYWRRRDSQRKI